MVGSGAAEAFLPVAVFCRLPLQLRWCAAVDSPFVAVFVGADHRRLRNSAFSNVAVYHSGRSAGHYIKKRC